MKSSYLAFLSALMLALMASCGPSAEEAATQTAAAWTPTSVPPTHTPTPVPTATPTHTATPTATSTPTPTITPTPSITPTLSPQTVILGAGEPIRIGSLLAESLGFGLESRYAVELALDDAGMELLGHPLMLVAYDTHCNELAAGRAALMLAEGKVLGVIGTSCSGAALNALAELSPAGVVMISPSNTGPSLTSAPSHNPWYFRTAPNDSVQARAVVNFAFSELKARTMATVTFANHDYSLGIAAAACQELSTLGGECVAARQINQGDTYLIPTLNRIGYDAPDVLFLIVTPQEAAAAIQQFRATPGLEDTAVFVQELSFGPNLLELAGEPAVGVYLSHTATEVDRSSDAYQTYLLGYLDKAGTDPASNFHAFAYDATNMLLEAIRRAAIPQEDGSLLIDRQAVRAQLYAIQGFAGVTGSLTCSESGDCASNSMTGVVYRIDDADPGTWNPGVGLAANPIQVWPVP